MARKVSVTINGKEYVSAESKKAGDSLKKLGDTSDAINNAIKVGFVAAAAAVAGAVAAMTKAVSSTEKMADNVDKMSQKIGISREAFQEWDFIMSQNGMSIAQLRTGVKTLSSAAEEASRGVITYTRTFDALGVSILNADGNLKDQESLLFDTIYALTEVENTTQRTALATDLLGRSATELAPLLNSGSASIEELRQKAHDLGLVLNDETIDAGVRLHDTFDQMKRTFAAVMANAVTPLMKTFDQLGQNMLAQTREGGGIRSFIDFLVRGIAWVANSLPKVGAVFAFTTTSVGSFAKYLGRKIDEGKEKLVNFLDSFGALDLINDTIKFTVEVFGETYEAIIEGFEKGDWSRFWGVASDTLSAGIGIALTIVGAAKAGAIALAALRTAFGFAAANAGIIKAGALGTLSVFLALKEAQEEGNWGDFKNNLSTAILAGLIAGGLTLNPTTGVFVASIAMSLNLGEFLENLVDKLPDPEDVAQAIKDWWNNNIGDALNKFFEGVGEGFWGHVWNGILITIEQFNFVGKIIDKIRGNSDKKEVQSMGEETGENLVTGLENGLSGAKEIGMKMGEDVINGLNASALINSPSKKTEKTGEFLIEGLRIGVENKMGVLDNTWSSLIASWREAWGEHSPLDVTKTTGMNAILGLIEGISDPQLKSELMSALKTLVAAFNDELVIDPDKIMDSITGNGTPSSEELPQSGYSQVSRAGATPWRPKNDLIRFIEKVGSGFAALANGLDSFEAVLNPLGTIFSSMVEILQPAIDSILNPIMSVLKILGGTLGKVLLPVFEAVGKVVEKLAEGFVWFHNKVIKPVGDFLYTAFAKIANGLITVVNGVIDGINWALGWAGVDIAKVSKVDENASGIDEISLDNMGGVSGSDYAGSAAGSSTSVQQMNINVYQYFQGNVIGDGGLAQVGEFCVDAIREYSGIGGTVKIMEAS